MGGRGRRNRNTAPLQAPDNSAQIKAMQAMQEMQQQYDQQAKNFAKKQAEVISAQNAAQDAASKAAQEAARQQAIFSQSANARSLATGNQQEIGNKLQSILSTPIQEETINYATLASGYSPYAAKQEQTAQMGSAYSPFAAKQEQAAQMGSAGIPATVASPVMAIAAKVNAGSGGTNAVQNQYTMPNTTGLTFGGA